MIDTENPVIKIGFTYEDELGEEFSASSSRQIFEDLGEAPLDIISEQLNIFLKQIGFVRRNEYILMDDLTADEYDALKDYLEQLRNNKTDEE